MDAVNPQPQQKFATDGVRPLSRPNPIVRLFMGVVAFAERLNLKYAIHGNPPVYDTSAFPWVAVVEEAYPGIRAELENILDRKDELPNFHDIATDVKVISQDASWKTFFFTAFGRASAPNVARCPRTWAALQAIPGLKTAMFSIFEPGKHLPPHRGPYNGVLRLHLGLIVPEQSERLAIRVENEMRHWHEGKVLIFDDAYQHEAWNHTAKTRVILFVDFLKPLRFPANALNWLLLNLAVFTPFVREGLDAHKAWEKKFYAEAERLRNKAPGN